MTVKDDKNVYGVRVWETLKPGERQPLLNQLVAIVTLIIYCGFMNYFIPMCVFAFFSRTCMYMVIFLLSTLLLPRKPLLWSAFNRCWVFKTWREYFKSVMHDVDC